MASSNTNLQAIHCDLLLRDIMENLEFSKEDIQQMLAEGKEIAIYKRREAFFFPSKKFPGFTTLAETCHDNGVAVGYRAMCADDHQPIVTPDRFVEAPPRMGTPYYANWVSPLAILTETNLLDLLAVTLDPTAMHFTCRVETEDLGERDLWKKTEHSIYLQYHPAGVSPADYIKQQVALAGFKERQKKLLMPIKCSLCGGPVTATQNDHFSWSIAGYEMTYCSLECMFPFSASWL